MADSSNISEETPWMDDSVHDANNGDIDELDDEDYGSDDENPNLIFLPFQAIKEYPTLLNHKTIFKPDQPIVVRITNVERSTHPIFHPHIYEIEIKHAGYYWVIRRRFQRIHNLHRRLRLYALSLRITRKRTLDHLSSDLKPRLPALPKRIDFFITPEQLEGRRVKLEHFFQSLLNTPLWREHPETLRFLEVSELSFMGELGEKGKEMPLQKLSGRPLHRVRNSTRDLVLKFGQQRDLDDWLKYFQYVLSTSAAQFVRPHPYGSSFPVADALELAEKEIFITDWYEYTDFDCYPGERWRLDRILQRRAEAGVKIYVMLYKEVPIALGINSHYSKAVLTVDTQTSRNTFSTGEGGRPTGEVENLQKRPKHRDTPIVAEHLSRTLADGQPFKAANATERPRQDTECWQYEHGGVGCEPPE
ncbi:putative Phospholipase D1 [Hypsibius exemplaris]|uniref:Phospholipase D1 n=1 Tax=Hypsibius exemplaris TaxID=2072580 RepID=A0A9X6RNE9_HYPEX|nr:putative Phospholipase D1 [Hypsibius exemplaris]